MSSICGIMNIRGDYINPEILSQFNNSLSNYGGDKSDIWILNNIGFGHQMACLTTESINEKLPYYSELSKVAITADIRLFNRSDLCNKLNLIDSSNLSDSQIVLTAYLKYGKNFPKHLLGEYAIVLWDVNYQELICVTDHANQMPLYYYQDSKTFIFASSINAINQLPYVTRSINFRKIALSSYLTAQQYPGETYFTNIKFLPAASIMILKANGNSYMEHYWQPSLPEVRYFKSEDEYAEAFQDIFSQVMIGATRGHLPICSTLSGGLDSSSVTIMAANTLAKQNKNLTSLSAVLPDGYLGDLYDESHYINLVQAKNLTKLNINDTQYGPFDSLDDFMDKPNTMSRHYLYKAFNDNARLMGSKIILTGVYGEFGPSYWNDEYLAELFRKGNFINLIRNIYFHKRLFKRSLKSILFNDVLQPNLPSNWQYKLRTMRNLDNLTRFSLIRLDFINKYVNSGDFTIEANKFKTLGTKPSLDGRYNNLMTYKLLFDKKSPSSQEFIEKGKSVINYCHPFLDKRILEFCFSVPNELRYKNGYRRYMIRRGMQGLMPNELCYRTTKEPFSPDYNIRYNKQISIAQKFLRSLSNNPVVKEVIDIDKLNEYLKLKMRSNRCYAKDDFIGMHTVPRALYLASFIENNS